MALASNSPRGVRSPFFVCIVLLLAIVGSADPAAGHGILVGSFPRANAVLQASLPEVILAFNEPVDETFSTVQIVDNAGRALGGIPQVSSGGRRVRVRLGPSPPGTYTVRWRVLSAVDGHATAGTFAFSVGQGRAVEQSPQTGERPSPGLVAARWLGLLTGVLAAGVVAYQSIILDPILKRLAPGRVFVILEILSPRLRILQVSSLIIFFVALAWEFVAHAAVVLLGDTAAMLRRELLVPLIVETRSGWSLVVRAFMAALLLMPVGASWRILRAAAIVWFVVLTAVIIFLGGPPALRSSHVIVIVLVAAVYGLASVMASVILPGVRDVRVPEWRWIGPVAAGLMLWGFTVGSHAASGGVVASIVDWLHLSAAALWVGGLPALLVTLRTLPEAERTPLARLLVPHVSKVAGIALLVMILTGTVAAWRNVGVLRGLVQSFYGQVLLVKLGLVALLVLLGALNRFVFRPRVASGRNGRSLNLFRLSVGAEVALGAAILVAAAILTVAPPAAITQASRENRSIVLAGITQTFRVRISVSPAEPGWNDVDATVVRLADDRPVLDAAVQVIMRGMDRVEDRAFGLTPSEGNYTASGDFLTAGWWDVQVRVDGEETHLPLIAGDVPRPAQPEARTFLERVRREMSMHDSWREIEQITDGRGNVVLTRFEAVRPDKLHYRTSSGLEVIIVGNVRFMKEPGAAWRRDQLPQPLSLQGPLIAYLNGAESVRFGREDICGDDRCRVVLWEIPSARASFAARVSVRSDRIVFLAMVAPEHYMTSQVYDLGARMRIAPP